MGLRINTNIEAMQALYNLNLNSQNQAKSLERLSTGLRINRGSDDPSGLVISELLKSQLSSLNQAVQNSDNASNLISVADSGLSQISNLLTTIQGSVNFALNTGGATSAQISAQQALVDQAVSAINRIGNTTRFSDQNLLNGTQGYIVSGTGLTTAAGAAFTPVTGGVNNELLNFNTQSVIFPQGVSRRNLTVQVLTVPQRAEIRISGFSNGGASATQIAASGNTTLTITGPTGTANVFLTNGTVNSGIEQAINGVAAQTGVYASGVAIAGAAGFSRISLFSSDFGSNQTIQISVTAGAIGVHMANGAAAGLASISTRNNADTNGAVTTLTAAAALGPASAYNTTKAPVLDTGRDGQVRFEGTTYTGKGVSFSILTGDTQVSFDINRDQVIAGIDSAATVNSLQINDNYTGAAVGTGINITSAVLKSGGLLFQINSQPLASDQVAFALPAINSTTLGSATIRDRVSEAVGNLTLPITAAQQINKGGFLNSLTTGGTNSLSNNPQNAGNVITAAINQVAQLRGFIGAVQAENIQPNSNAVNTEIQNLSASLSTIRDVNFAAETSNFTKTQILFQSGIAVLASANLIPQSVLTLLR